MHCSVSEGVLNPRSGASYPARFGPRYLPVPFGSISTVLGSSVARPARRLRRPNVLVVTRLDRLARSTLDLLSILQRVTEAGAKFRCLKDSWADTTTQGELMVTILAGLATFERHLIRSRTEEGKK